MANDPEQLKSFLSSRCGAGAALAFSGGVDSTLLLAVLCECRKEKDFPLLAITANTPLQSKRDMEDVREIAAGFEVPLELVDCDVLMLDEVRNNHPDRCYHCKRFIFESMLKKAGEYGIGLLFEGTHADDLASYRPGIKALKELSVVSPLAELGIGKVQIRELAASMGIKIAAKPSSPCLATRFEYGTRLTAEKIGRTGKGEEFLRSILPADADLRLRVHGDLARIEINADNFHLLFKERQRIVNELRKNGFSEITLDLAGFRSGSFDHIADEADKM